MGPVTERTPRQAGFRLAAEWEPHAACWLAWPHSEKLWGHYLQETRAAFTALCVAIADSDQATGRPRGEALHILVQEPADESLAREALREVPAHFHRTPYGDVWLRDTGPLFVTRPDGAVAAVRFAFNGWGGKYLLEHDDLVAEHIARLSGLPTFSFPWVLEGGSIEVDGQGTCLTTRQCLLNPNRNPGLDQRAIEAGLRDTLGVERVLWLDRGLVNDHTDGHVDTLARFVAPAIVMCMEAAVPDDPNAAVLDRAARDLASFSDAQGRSLTLVRIPSPGRILDDEGQLMPASYLNFYVGNRAVVVPVYGSPQDRSAVEIIGACFPGRRTVAIRAAALVAGGGGAFHCITQQVPAPGMKAGADV